MALVWDTTKSFLTGIFECASAEDTELLRNAIDAELVPHARETREHLLSRIVIHYNNLRREDGKYLMKIEMEVGLTREENSDHVWFWEDDEFRGALKQNSLSNRLAYLEKSLNFAVQRFGRV